MKGFQPPHTLPILTEASLQQIVGGRHRLPGDTTLLTTTLQLMPQPPTPRYAVVFNPDTNPKSTLP